MRHGSTILILVVGLLVSGWVSLGVAAAEITLFAAASLSDALKQVSAGYEKETGYKIRLNFGASNMLARQIAEGAPADLFFSADEMRMDELAAKGGIEVSTRRSLLSNTLVVVVAVGSPLKIRTMEDLLDARIRRLALADPRTVPAGIYSRMHLEKLKLWAKVEPRVIPTENVRAALAAVESGNVDAGMVYRTDAAISSKVKVAFEVSRAEGPVISYPVAVVKSTRVTQAANRFLAYLESGKARAVFEQFGFVVLR